MIIQLSDPTNYSDFTSVCNALKTTGTKFIVSSGENYFLPIMISPESDLAVKGYFSSKPETFDTDFPSSISISIIPYISG
jgi:hypothetical protein